MCANKGTCLPDGDTGAKCDCFEGFRGKTCEIECVGSAARPCSKRGICEADGTCTCLGGWRGADCSIECPGSNIFPCNIHGKCTRDAKCECDPLYRGAACEFRCPDVYGVPCGGRGTCNSRGKCECNYGYRGQDCMQECPVRFSSASSVAQLPLFSSYSVWLPAPCLVSVQCPLYNFPRPLRGQLGGARFLCSWCRAERRTFAAGTASVSTTQPASAVPVGREKSATTFAREG